MVTLDRGFKKKVNAAWPDQRFEVILSLKRSLGDTGLRGEQDRLGADFIDASAESTHVVLKMPACNILRLEKLSDDMERVIEDAPVQLIR